MSGSTIGGVVGAAIGFVVSGFNPAGAMWGWQIGSLVGAIVDPDVIEGPRLQESRTQTATDGVALTYGHGTYRCAGNVTWVDEVKEHRNEDDGKGGPTQVTYTYTISYMVTVCKGPISGYKLIRRNGKIVYDARTDAELTALGYTSQEIAETRAAQAEFLQRATLYYGTNDQMPDPTMVAVLGAGNVPAYTGVAYIVMTDDETREGEYAQFEFVVANCGDRADDWTTSGRVLVTGTALGTGQPRWAYADADENPSWVGVNQSAGADLPSPAPPALHAGQFSVVSQGESRHAIAPAGPWEAGGTNASAGDKQKIAAGPAGVIVKMQGELTDGRRIFTAPAITANFSPLLYQYNTTVLRYVGGYYWIGWTYSLSRSADLINWEEVYSVFDEQQVINFYDIESFGGDLYAIVDSVYQFENRRVQIRKSSDGGATWPTILLDMGPQTDTDRPLQLQRVSGGVLAYCENGYVRTLADDFATPVSCGLAGFGVMNTVLGFSVPGRKIASAGTLAFILGGGADANKCVTTTNGVDFSTPTTIPLADTYGIVASEASTYGVEVPDAPGFYINPTTGIITGPSGTQIDPCQPTLGEIVAAQCDKRGVDSRDVSELTDLVGGYRIAKPSSPLANIQGLQPAYLFGASEFDGKLHFPKRGRDLTFALTYDDMVEREGDLIQWERVQERDLLRKVTVAYTDPATNYADTTQQAERRSATVNAEGESVMELPITGDKDWAAQVADKSIKVAWGEPDECTFHVSIAHAELVTGAEGSVPYTDGTPTVVRIERIDDEGLVRMVHARKTRRHLYESNASGAAKPLPRFPGSNVRGPTDGLLMNLPVLLDQDDRPGIHWAAAGMLSGWQGGQLQIRRAGQWTVAGTVYSSAGVGTLRSALSAHAGDVDTANVLRVQFNEPLSSVTWENLLQERNPFAILRPDGTAEIVQAQTVTATAPGEYELTTLLRRRLATATAHHDIGARVVLLDQRVQYASLEATDLGTTLEYRFVSVGTNPDAAPILTLDLTTMESQREWPVAGLSVEVDGDDYTLTWLRRDRLGTDVLPIRSANWAGYEVSYSHSGGSGSVVVTTESHTFTLPGASDITFSVAQLNQYTGAGPAQTVTIP